MEVELLQDRCVKLKFNQKEKDFLARLAEAKGVGVDEVVLDIFKNLFVVALSAFLLNLKEVP